MKTVLDAEGIESTILQLAEQLKPIVAGRSIAFIGLKSRGDEVASRLFSYLAEDDTAELFFGSLDVSLYRDDLSQLKENPKLQDTEIDFPLDDAHVILVDDVLNTGRTIRAALDALTDYGRPAKIELAVLIDRGNREYPIQPDYVGLSLETKKEDKVRVQLDQEDEQVTLIEQ